MLFLLADFMLQEEGTVCKLSYRLEAWRGDDTLYWFIILLVRFNPFIETVFCNKDPCCRLEKKQFKC
jgi:hypothetical protein